MAPFEPPRDSLVIAWSFEELQRVTDQQGLLIISLVQAWLFLVDRAIVPVQHSALECALYRSTLHSSRFSYQLVGFGCPLGYLCP